MFDKLSLLGGVFGDEGFKVKVGVVLSTGIILSTVRNRRNCIIRPNTLLMKSLFFSEEFLKFIQ